MSAIFGIVHWDGQPVASADLTRMDRALAACGADGGTIWREGCIGLGHRLSHVTPEDRFEQQPLRSEGRQVLVADARIDNRDELSRAWSVAHAETREWADSAFVARALDTWNDEAPARLRGAFAFAHWDGRAGRLLLARSPLFERPLFYHTAPGIFVFASMPRGLFASGVIARHLDETFLADFLALERFASGTTFYRGVRRVQAGHVLVVTASGIREWPFWRPDLIPELKLSNDEAYVDAFNEVYSRVVGDALRSEGPVGLMLSGGLDSSSVAATAAPLLAAHGRRLKAFTDVPSAAFSGSIIPGRYANETPFVEELARGYPNIDLAFIQSDGRFFLDDPDRWYSVSEAPVRGALNLTWWEALMEKAQEQHVRVLLHASAGNFTASWNGSGLLSQLLAHGRWREAFSEARAISRAYGSTSTWRAFVGLGVVPWLPDPVYLGFQQLRSLRHSTQRPWHALSPVRPAFKAAHAVRARARAMGPDARFRLRPDTRPFRRVLLRRVSEMLDGFLAGCQARFALDMRDPTADTRLVEFCLSLPEEQYERHGRRRWLIRRAFVDRLPPCILDNPQRGLQAAEWLDRAIGHRDHLFDDLARLERCDLASKAIDLERLRRIVERLPTRRANDVRAMEDFRALELGLITGRFILWAQMPESQS